MPEDKIECGSFTVISIGYLFVYKNKYHLQLYLENYAYKVANKQITDFLGNNLFKKQILYYDAV